MSLPRVDFHAAPSDFPGLDAVENSAEFWCYSFAVDHTASAFRMDLWVFLAHFDDLIGNSHT
jgi:hypothetical protein